MSSKKLIIAGPCAVESKGQIEEIYAGIKGRIDYFRAGAYKPRTNPESFQGLGKEGLDILNELKDKEAVKVVSEIVSIEHMKEYSNIDMLQIGARNMQNFELLKRVGELNKKVLLKRGFSATYEEFIGAARYLEQYGAKEVILCERGIRTFSDTSRFTLDLAMIIKVKNETDYQIIVDPSHAAGTEDMVVPLAKAALSAGADGLMIEVHNNPQEALSDKNQQLTVEEFEKFISEM